MIFVEIGRGVVDAVRELHESSSAHRKGKDLLGKFPVNEQLLMLERLVLGKRDVYEVADGEYDIPPYTVYKGRRWDIKGKAHLGTGFTPGMIRKEVRFSTDGNEVTLLVSTRAGFKGFFELYESKALEGAKKASELNDQERIQFCFDNAEQMTGPIERWDSGHF